ncbi:MAG: hypothetical protein IKX24_06085 [Prevotella sp.]|nr:hypothetical protein [Prevotella sp.]
MKKIFTFFAAVLLSCNAFAQSDWKDLVVNGNMEGAQDPLWSSFWCHDWREGVEFDAESGQQYDDGGQFQGFAEIIEDPMNPGNHCARVIARSEAEADEAGNKVAADGALASWDCQFFIYGNETIPEGAEVRMTLRVRAEKNGNFQTQAHYQPGNYNHWSMFGDVNVTTEWQTVQVSTTVVADQTQESNGKFFQSVAFNLSTNKEGNVFYFDDVKLEVRTPEPPKPLSDWLDIVRKGIESDDQITFANGTFTTFTGRDGTDGVDRPARIVNDPLDGQPALEVKSIGWNATMEKKTEATDEDGNPILDEEGNPTYTIEDVPIHIKENGDTLTSIDDWQTQFFVSHRHVFHTGEKIKFSIEARAEIPTNIGTQIHKGPGDYKHWQMFGDLGLTEEWQRFEFEQDITSDQTGTSTVAFNLNIYKDGENTYYFRNIEFCCNEADATDEERTLGSEDVVFPIPAKGQETTIDFDMSNAVSTLLVSDFIEFLLEKSMKMPTADGTLMEEPVSIGDDGAVIDENGVFIVDGGVIGFDVDPVVSADNIAKLTIANFGGDFTADQTIISRIYFIRNGWYYLYNATFVDQAIYDGIENVATQAMGKETIYDLAGRKVATPTKGIYIKNGKKFVLQ